MKRIDLYGAISPAALAKGGRQALIDHPLPRLNPFEVAIYGHVLDSLETPSTKADLAELWVDGHNLAMLNLLLAASTDKKKLEAATRVALQDLNQAAHKDPCLHAAIDSINRRLRELSKQ